MKRMFFCGLAAIVITVAVSSVAGAQSQASSSLGDYARAVKKTKDPVKTSGKVYDNDNLPSSDHISVVGNATDSTGPEDANPAPEANSAKPENGVTPSAPSQDATKKTDPNDAWKQKIADQQGQVDLLSRELDVTQREYRLRAAAFYADAGNRLRGSATWDKEDAQYKQQIAQKQKAVDDAKKALDDLKEQARKAGVPAKLRE